jgi:NDP-sugar pyrophosphorylase family protein
MSFHQPNVSLRDDLVRCFSLVVPHKTVFAHRANNVASYLYANRHVSTGSIGAHTPWQTPESHGPKTNRFKGAVVGAGCEFDTRCGANMSVLGERCTLGAKAEVAHSVLMDGVKVGPDAVVKSCIVGRNVVIGRKCHLSGCQIADGADVPEGTCLKDEAIEGSGGQVAGLTSMDDVEGEFMFEI